MNLLEKNLVVSFLEKLNAKTFFLLVFVYQLLFIFQGFEMSDEGFNATFYQQIYRDPLAVQYNFMFWLAGIIGGAWTWLFPGLGMIGIRLAGVLVTTGTIIVCYNLLKRHLHTTYLKLGLLLVLLFISNDTKEIYYNNLSALTYLLIASLLFNGLTKGKKWSLFTAGALVALNVFIRIPSAMGVGLVAAIVYYGLIAKTPLKVQVRQILFFGAGGVAATGIVFLFMKAIGHFDIFMDCMNWLVNLGKSADTGDAVVKSKDSTGYYGIMTQVKTFTTGITTSLKYSLIIIIVAIAASTIGKFIQHRFNAKWLVTLAAWGMTLVLCWVVLQGSKIFNYPNLTLLYIYTGFTLIIAALILLGKSPAEMKLLTFIGVYITLTYPIGSRGGITSAGIYCFWLSFPIIIHYLFQVREMESANFLTRSLSAQKESFNLKISDRQLDQLRKYGIYIMIVGCLYSAYFYPFSDLSNRMDMRYSINNKYLRGILTTKERAQTMNELIAEMNKHIKKGEYVLAYDAIPMIHYMTETRPYIKNSYPWLYAVPVLKEELTKAENEITVLPVVIQQRSATNSHRSIGWPVISTEEFSEWNEERNTILKEFLDRHQYKETWRNNAFIIYLPSNPQ